MVASQSAQRKASARIKNHAMFAASLFSVRSGRVHAGGAERPR